jgi:DNA-binding LacI/PurR family transcriptional regulator
LRDKAWVSPTTRDKVHEAAQRLGYRADPVYSTLGRRAREGRKAAGLGIAVVFDESHPEDARRKIVETLQPLVEERGCYWNVLEVTPDMPPNALQRILRARNISGVILPKVRFAKSSIARLNLENVSVIADPGTWQPPYHTVHSDYFDAVTRLCETFYARGRRRLGFALTIKEPPAVDDLRRFGGIAAFCRVEQPGLELLEPWRPPPGLGKDAFRQDFAQWVQRNQPDAVLGFSEFGYWALRDQGIDVPGQIAYAGLLLGKNATAAIGGMRIHPRIDKVLVDHLIADILAGMRGHTLMSRRSLVSMQFIEGESLG